MSNQSMFENGCLCWKSNPAHPSRGEAKSGAGFVRA
jgi:hypothetical protein